MKTHKIMSFFSLLLDETKWFGHFFLFVEYLLSQSRFKEMARTQYLLELSFSFRLWKKLTRWRKCNTKSSFPEWQRARRPRFSTSRSRYAQPSKETIQWEAFGLLIIVQIVKSNIFTMNEVHFRKRFHTEQQHCNCILKCNDEWWIP